MRKPKHERFQAFSPFANHASHCLLQLFSGLLSRYLLFYDGVSTDQGFLSVLRVHSQRRNQRPKERHFQAQNPTKK
jgi:hypothetical protein